MTFLFLHRIGDKNSVITVLWNILVASWGTTSGEVRARLEARGGESGSGGSSQQVDRRQGFRGETWNKMVFFLK